MLHKLKKQKQFLRVAIFALGFSTPVFANEDINQITEHLKKGDFSIVKAELVPLAENGDPRAQFNLGISYKFGHGIDKDLQKSLVWTQRAAEQGYVRAEVNLAGMYADGVGTPKNVMQAVNWYQKASTDGDANADLSLAKIYRDGVAGKVDYARAFEYFTRAADKGNTEAKYNMAAFYHYGYGVAKNEAKAKELFASLKQAESPTALNSYNTAAGTDSAVIK